MWCNLLFFKERRLRFIGDDITVCLSCGDQAVTDQTSRDRLAASWLCRRHSGEQADSYVTWTTATRRSQGRCWRGGRRVAVSSSWSCESLVTHTQLWRASPCFHTTPVKRLTAHWWSWSVPTYTRPCHRLVLQRCLGDKNVQKQVFKEYVMSLTVMLLLMWWKLIRLKDRIDKNRLD